MTGIRFQSWERFLYYVQKKEKMEQKTGANNNSKPWKAEHLKADEWKWLQKALSFVDCEERTKEKSRIEIKSFSLTEKGNQIVFFAAGKECKEGGYFCIGYGIVDKTARKDNKSRFVQMKDLLNKRKSFYCIGTERDYWENYPILQMDVPEPILENLASQAAILDNNFGAKRDVERDSGGFCVVFPKAGKAAKEACQQILKKYNILESMYECLEIIIVNGLDWVNALYLTNNDFGINLIYPKEAQERIHQNKILSNQCNKPN